MGYYFANSTGIVYIGSPTAYSSKQPFTVSAWICEFGGQPGRSGKIICKDAVSQAPYVGAMSGRWGLTVTSFGALRFQKYGTGGNAVWLESINNSLIDDGTAYHVAAWWNGSNVALTSIKLFINGIETIYGNYTDSTAEVLTGDDLLPLCIGNGSDNKFVFNGNISEVAWYSTTLETYEIQQLATPIHGMPRQVRPDKLLGYWALNEFSDGVLASGDSAAINLSSNNLCGTPYGAISGAGVYPVSYYP